MEPAPEPRHAKVAQALQSARLRVIDRVTAEVVTTLRHAGVRAIVIKGPVFAQWLYRDGAIRSYSDSDVMVSPAQTSQAEAVLRSLGFEPWAEPSGAYSEAMGPKHAACWARDWPGGALVDLHDSLAGACADKAAVWAAVSRDTATMRVGDALVEVAGPAANALIVALHAANNGPGHDRSCEDLTRAIEVVDADTWAAASRLAAETGAEEMFGAGLRILPRGRELAEQLALARPETVDVLLRAAGAPDGAVFLDHLAATSSWSGRARLLGRALVPDASYMRNQYPLAARGRTGLAASYGLRLGRRLAGAVPALLALTAAQREARAGTRRGPD
jgi:putative nucleotidyltransferase-like protein